MGERPGETASAIRIFSIWRRAAPVYWEHFRADGSECGAGYDWAEIQVRAGAWASSRAVGVDHVAPEERDPGEAGSPVKSSGGWRVRNGHDSSGFSGSRVTGRDEGTK